MRESWAQKLLANPWPRRRETAVATWWEWRCRSYRLRSKVAQR